MIGFLCLTVVGSSFATRLYRRLNQTKECLCAEKNIALDRKAEFPALGIDSGESPSGKDPLHNQLEHGYCRYVL
ncbi:hypothetical protein B0H19DRAFT_1113849 [Mycena capillaripes]|nr:hypothetical protein B0H19DRAFT_1113849 [Mycena capillaripes]